MINQPAENPRWRAKIRRKRQRVGAGLLALVIVPMTMVALDAEPMVVIRHIPKLFAVKGETVEALPEVPSRYSPSADWSSSTSSSSLWLSTSNESFSYTSATVPEPTSLVLIAPALMLLRRRKRA